MCVATVSDKIESSAETGTKETKTSSHSNVRLGDLREQTRMQAQDN